VVPVNPMNKSEELRHYVEDADATTILATQEQWPQIAPLAGSSGLKHIVLGAYSDYLSARTDLPVPDFVRAPRERIEQMFVSMLRRANHLRQEPEHYNTLTNTCTTNIVRHVNELVPGRIPWSYKLLLPGYSDELAYELGLIDTALPFPEAKRRFRIDDGALRAAGQEDFSRRIRQGL